MTTRYLLDDLAEVLVAPSFTRMGFRLRERLFDWSMSLFERLGCRDYAGFDWRADASGEIKLLEVNPNPGWCWDGKLNFMAGYAGMRYAY